MLAAVPFAAAACGSDEARPDPARAVTPAPKATAPGEGRLDLLLAERAAVDPSVAGPFEQETGCRVTVTATGSEARTIAAATEGSRPFDLVATGGEGALPLIRGGAVQPLDLDGLDALDEVDRPLRAVGTRPLDGRRYGLPFAWDANVLAYDTRSIDAAPDSWQALYDPGVRGRVAVPDRVSQIADAGLVLRAGDPWSLTSADLRAASLLLGKQRPLVHSYWTSSGHVTRLFATRAVDLAAVPAATVAAMRRSGLPVEATVPAEGATGWIYSWMLARSARHPVCAYRFLRYVLTPAAQARVVERTGRAPANVEACDVLGAERCRELHGKERAWSRVVRFARTPDEPTGVREWQQAWASAVGRRTGRP